MVGLSRSIRNGRRAVSSRSHPAAGLLAGVAFGERDVRVAIADESREILAQQLMPLQADHVADDGMERAARLLADLAETVSSGVEDIGAIGFGLPAPVDSVSGEAASDAVLPGWRGVNVAEAMAATCGPRSRSTTPPTWPRSASSQRGPARRPGTAAT